MKDIAELERLGGVVAPKHKSQEEARRDQKQITTWHDKAVKAQLRQIAAEQDTTMQRLMAEAINMVFTKYGKGPIA